MGKQPANNNPKKQMVSLLGVLGSIASIASLFSGNFILQGIGAVLVLVLIVALIIFCKRKHRAVPIDTEKDSGENAREFEDRIYKMGEASNRFYEHCRNELARIRNGTKIDANAFENIISIFCTEINIFFNILLPTENSVCVKRIKTETILDGNVGEWEIITFGRSTMTRPERSKGDRIPCKVGDNTDFELILSGAEDAFACPDLKKTAEKFKNEKSEVFKNSRKDFLKYYRSAIVVPIGIPMENVSSRLKNQPAYKADKNAAHIVGFLCIDSMNTYPEENIAFMSAVKYAMSFSDTLYPLIESYLVAQLPKPTEYTEVAY